MSKIKNNGEFKPGSIYRIALENFLTYEEVVLYPGPSLNMIIGPNGAGKSTFVCAIILGLCGKTRVIGRAKKISDYVRSGCQTATIEIELYQEPGQRNVIITRSFDRRDVSTWMVDSKTVREKQVQDIISALNIQVDNLCQMLPQDRVQDFSKMNPQELLRSTLAAVGGKVTNVWGKESVERLDELIKCRIEQRNSTTKLQNSTQLMDEQIRINERLKIQIDAMRQRKKIIKKIEICEKKKLWLEYQELREKVVEYTSDKKRAEKCVKQHKDRMEPLERVIDAARRGTGALEKQKLAAGREAHTLQDRLEESLRAVQTQEHMIHQAETNLAEKVDTNRNRERELMEAKAKLDKLVMDRVKLVDKVGDEQKVRMDMAELNKPLQKIKAAMDTLRKQRMEAQYDLENNITPQIRLYQNKVRSLQDVGAKRLEVLRQHSEDTYKAVMWLRDNRDMFQGNVYEPMMLEINFNDPKFAMYLESAVASRDLVAFTFENTRDMNMFLQKVRVEGNLKHVNAVQSTSGPVPQCPNIENLRYLGFSTYLLDTMTAPDAILRYLCKNYKIDRIPIGDIHTYNNSDKVPANITYFFTEKHRFTVRVSAYSGEKSSSTVEVSGAQLLANTVDSEQLANYQGQLSAFEQSAETRRTKLQEIDGQLTRLESSQKELITQRNRITENCEKIKSVSSLIRLQKARVIELDNKQAFDIDVEKRRCREKQKECVMKQRKLHEELMGVMKSLQEKNLKAQFLKEKLDVSRNAIVQQEAELRELKREMINVQKTLENIENLLTRSKSRAKEKLMEAKRASNNKLPQDPEFPYKDEFDSLPSDLSTLQEHCIELQTRIECMAQGDEQVIAEYAEREKTIARLRSEVGSSGDAAKQLEERMNEIKAEWLPPLLSLLGEINRQFGDMFAKLNCAGEVKLDKGDTDDDYDKYGVSILVRFRSTEQLQQLTRHVQSGGERAITTALYLLALQRLTTVPFRCVDEINQGMDPINERQMFQLLFKVTTECDTQYFLLTPKLLPNLEYNEKIIVHTIMNGKGLMNYRQWNLNTFLANAQKINA